MTHSLEFGLDICSSTFGRYGLNFGLYTGHHVAAVYTLGSHQKTRGDSQYWMTPKFILDALGPFDLDPAGAGPRPWECATLIL